MADANYIHCPNCGVQYRLTEQQRREAAGKSVKCKQCQQPFVAPALAQSPDVQYSEVQAPTAVAVLADAPRQQSSFPQVQYATPQYGAPQYDGGQYVSAPPGNGMAVAGFVLSLIWCLPVCPLLGIIFSAIGLSRSHRPELAGRGKGLSVAGLIIGILGLFIGPILLYSMLLPSFSRSRTVANRVKSAANLRSIGMMITLYENNNGGHMPDNFGQMLVEENMLPNVFVSPNSKDTPAPGQTTAQQAANLDSGGHDSYVYVGRGQRMRAPFDFVLAYESPSDNAGQGCNVLFHDGSVNWVSSPAAQQMIKEVQAGRNPAPSAGY